MGGAVRSQRIGSRLTPALASVMVAALVVGLAACGGSSKSSSSTSNTISAGQVDIKLPPGWKVTKNGVSRPASSNAGAPAGNSAASPGSTAAPSDGVPLAKEDPTTKFFGAVAVFQSCLKGLGTKFIGVPSAADPNSPANNPDYIKSLSTCAAKSNIVQALKDQQTAQDNLTPAQIELQNKGYLAWRDCMIGRGWGIPEPKPDAKGRLFSFGSGGNAPTPNFTPPPGQDLLSSGDLQQCATESQQKVAPAGG
jgi:hypothetical protein